MCLSCGKRYSGLPTSGVVRHVAPFEWTPSDLAGKKQTPLAPAG